MIRRRLHAYSSLWSRAFGSHQHRTPPVVSSDNITAFRWILSDDPSALLQGASDLQRYNIDWTRHYQGHSELLLKPSTVEQVSRIAAYCNEHRLPIVTQAGNTSLVGGSVPMGNEIILSTERLNQIYGLDEFSGVLTAQAGCILQDLQAYCADRNYLVPVDLGAKGTCQIGGNVATNAGGQYYYRYGSLAGNLLGLEVVLADGRILQCGNNINIKDNTGYKLHQLMVGSEGTLGIITAVSLLCPPLPKSKQAVFLACQSYADVLAVMGAAKSDLGEILAAFEWMDESIVILVDERIVRSPLAFQDENRYFLLIETHGSDQGHDREKMERFLGRVMANGLVRDGVLAQDLSQIQSFWKLRESANPAMSSSGYTYKYDVSLPIRDFEDFISDMKRHLRSLSLLHGNWGHILDGNLHFNVCRPGVFEPDPLVLSQLEPYLFEQVIGRGGSISAEHGLGQSKNEYLGMVHAPATLDLMRDIKQLLDPNTILNPGKYFPTTNKEGD